jgi:hypothetical protein
VRQCTTLNPHIQRLEVLVLTLSADGPMDTSVLPNVFALLPVSASSLTTVEPMILPSLTVPPELEAADILKIVLPAADSSGLRGDEGVGYDGVRLYLRLFEDDVSVTLSSSRHTLTHAV